MEDIYLKYKNYLQNTELFAHLNEAAKDKYIWQQISRGKKLTKRFILDNKDKLVWSDISRNYSFTFDELLILKDHINWKNLMRDNYKSIECIEKDNLLKLLCPNFHHGYYSYHTSNINMCIYSSREISYCKPIVREDADLSNLFSEECIEENIDKFDFGVLSNSEKQFSENFLDNHFLKFDWFKASQTKKFSEEFFYKHKKDMRYYNDMWLRNYCIFNQMSFRFYKNNMDEIDKLVKYKSILDNKNLSQEDRENFESFAILT